jgi:hypothetical protein
MKVAVVDERNQAGVDDLAGPERQERSSPPTVELVASALEADTASSAATLIGSTSTAAAP